MKIIPIMFPTGWQRLGGFDGTVGVTSIKIKNKVCSKFKETGLSNN
jgi:hypothetical protein